MVTRYQSMREETEPARAPFADGLNRANPQPDAGER